MQIVNVEMDMDFSFFCPITGKLIIGPDFFEASPATAFVFSPEANDFDHLTPELRPVWEAIVEGDEDEDEDFDGDYFEKFREKVQNEPSLVLFKLRSHGIACGPVSSTVLIAVDFAYSSEESEDIEE